MENNQFDFMQFMNQEALLKSMQGMPAFDFSSFANIVKSNAEAITSTNQMASESMQSILKRGADSLQKNATEMFNSMKDATSAGDVEQMSSCQQKYLKSTIENNINNTKEILDMTSKSTREVLDVFGKSMSENLSKSFKK
ncbi:MAG: phasin family protein [Rickettsiaceae bacterium]|nr:phasin family protein [Rickettsiaceae bacterium]